MYIEGKHTSRFKIKEIKYIEWGTERSPKKLRRPTFQKLYIGKKILRGRQTEGVLDYMGLLNNDSLYVFRLFNDLKGVNNRSIAKSLRDNNSEFKREFLEKTSLEYSYEYILAILNSKYANVFLNAVRRHKLPNTFYPDDFREIPIKNLKDQSVFIKIVEILQFLFQIDGNQDLIEFFDEILLNFLIFELYFKEKLLEQGFNQNLLKFVSGIIKNIKYEDWTKFLFKELNDDELEEKEELENQNLERINQMYKELKIKKFFDIIKKMSQFEWIQKIENKSYL